jgi:hypothetical protein
MQAAFNKCGKFRGQLVKVIEDKCERSCYESAVIDRHFRDKRCMNLRKECADGGAYFSEESRRKIVESNLGRVHSEEARKKISVALKGRKASKSQVARLRKLNLGRKHTEEARGKISAANKGKSRSKSQRLKNGHIHSRPVVMFGPCGGEFYFPSGACAARYLSADRARLCAALSGCKSWPKRPRKDSRLTGWTGHYLNTEELQSAY